MSQGLGLDSLSTRSATQLLSWVLPSPAAEVSCDLRLGFAGDFGGGPAHLRMGAEGGTAAWAVQVRGIFLLPLQPCRSKPRSPQSPASDLPLALQTCLTPHPSLRSRDDLPQEFKHLRRGKGGSQHCTNTTISLLPSNYSRMLDTPLAPQASVAIPGSETSPCGSQRFSAFLECTGAMQVPV